MKKLTCLFVLFSLWIIPGILFSQTRATLTLPTMNAESGATIDVPITVSTDEIITSAQFVVEYNSTVLSFLSAEIGPDASGFELTINTDLPYEPGGPGTNENVLTQLWGGLTNTFTGESQRVVILKFSVTGNPGEYSPLFFDEGVARTYLSTTSFEDIAGEEINFVNGSVNFVVPVELSSFNVYANQNSVSLEWNTESESNNYGFEIQRKTEEGEFQKIGFVPGHNTTTIPHKYNFTDSDLSNGTYYYRLKQIDFGGAFEYSTIKTVTLSLEINFKLTGCYPNPFNPATTICFQIGNNVSSQGRVKLNVYNSLGELVRKLVDGSMRAGQHSVIWDGTNNRGDKVVSGTYICCLISNNKSNSLKITVIR